MVIFACFYPSFEHIQKDSLYLELLICYQEDFMKKGRR